MHTSSSWCWSDRLQLQSMHPLPCVLALIYLHTSMVCLTRHSCTVRACHVCKQLCSLLSQSGWTS